MRAILLAQSEITSINARVDKSIRFSVVTGELGDLERSAFFPLQGTNVRILIEPNDVDSEPPIEVKAPLDMKSPSQMMRSLLFLIWKESGSVGDFSSYYASRMDRACQKLRDELDSMKS